MKRPKAKPFRTKSTTDPAFTPPLEATEQKDELLICGLCHNRTDSVYYMSDVNTYAKLHSTKTPEKCLQEVERAKKKMYMEVCLQQR